MAKSRRNRRDKLFALDPHCFWCGRKLVNTMPKDGEMWQINMATLDHLFHRLDPDRPRRVRIGDQKTVLSCYGCNHKRGERDEAYYTLKLKNDKTDM